MVVDQPRFQYQVAFLEDKCHLSTLEDKLPTLARSIQSPFFPILLSPLFLWIIAVMCVWASCACLVPVEARGRDQILWNWSHRWLIMLETEPGTSPAVMTQGTQGTIRPASNFDAMRDAEILRKAMKGFGTDEQAIVDVVSNRSNDQRQQIKAAFKTMYGKDLIKDLKSELSGNMEELILALFMPSTYYDAWSLRKAMQGAGTQERVLIEILCTRTNQEIRDIVRCYQLEFGRELEKDIRSDTSGHFERLLVSMCQGNRDESQSVNHQMAQEDAQRLYQAGEGRLGTDESCFNMILATRSFPQLKATMEAYSRMANRDLLSSVSREFSGYVESGLKTILQCALNRPAFFAERLYYSMKGAGTDDSTLVRIVVTRSEIDLVQIKQMFTQMYQKTLSTMIASDTSGDYRKLLLAIVGQ
ncbi:annexin A7 isoform X3 [Arvicanthis niloticus]|uniref:annexin A7 isoform X3 n=1 Tax=Arvicanthis niloticus TaxID=61156 RepID=UPI00402B21C9